MQPHLCAGVTQKQAQTPARKSALQVNSSMSVTSAPLLHLLLHTFIASHVLLSDESLICHPPPPFALFLRLQGPGSPPGGLMEPRPWRSPLLKSHAVCVVGTTPKAWRWSLPLRWPDTPSAWMMGRELTNEGEGKKDRKEAAGWGMMRVFLFIFCYLVVL